MLNKRSRKFKNKQKQNLQHWVFPRFSTCMFVFVFWLWVEWKRKVLLEINTFDLDNSLVLQISTNNNKKILFTHLWSLVRKGTTSKLRVEFRWRYQVPCILLAFINNYMRERKSLMFMIFHSLLRSYVLFITSSHRWEKPNNFGKYILLSKKKKLFFVSSSSHHEKIK
jgi:hypothetical protein